ncbi:MAG: ATP-binding cassette domain-containing protein, partial [Bacteroidales bacterium]|nr:ATP-binding cassette domain-containing protein [Bacteroidales bacterium]
MNIINTVAEVFKIKKEEFNSIESYIKLEAEARPEDPSILKLDKSMGCLDCDSAVDGTDNGSNIYVLRIASVDLFFIKNYSDSQLFLNGLPLINGKVYIIAKGSSLRYKQGSPFYYSDISSHFLSHKDLNKISLVAEELNYVFPGNVIGLNRISIHESQGTLLGIMGSSGSGKTTLLNLLSGILNPSSGKVRINGIDIHNTSETIEGVIGFVPQDDLLIEDLTVFQNLYYAASLCFKNNSKKDLTDMVDKSLISLGLYEKRDLKVGSPLNKVISGGQRKRLNIALELIREPSILFLDEPTSGLSSRDSENVIDLLRELTFKGKLVVTVIHQPSSEIFKMFDRMLILDQGGEMAYYGNPVESLIHFKTLDAQVESSVGECPTCGNINPETIFNILETEVVDEFGRYTGVRKISPETWADEFRKLPTKQEVPEVKDPPPSNLEVPGMLRQLSIYSRRDLISKIANRQYVILTLFEAPILGFLLSYIIKYIADPSSSVYVFRENENIPIYIFMSLIVALFLGLITSAEEIFKDRKILKRERFLNLNRNSYLLSKVSVLFLISAIHAFLFVLIANNILEIDGLYLQYWLAFFTTAACANLIGLNISASFNSAITIYIVVPMLMIPMMVLSGAMFPFDKLNRNIGSVGRVPVIAEIMPTKWTYEALMVSQAKDNKYDKLVYDFNKEESKADYYAVTRLKALESTLNISDRAYRTKDLTSDNPSGLNLIRNEIEHLSGLGLFPTFESLDKINPLDYNNEVSREIKAYIHNADSSFNAIVTSVMIRRDIFFNANRTKLGPLMNSSHNDKLHEIVKKVYEPHKLLVYKDKLVQNIDPIFQDPEIRGPLSFRTHFFSPAKPIFGRYIDTFIFNIAIVWLMTLSLYILLYFDIFGRLVNKLNKK